MTSHNGGYEPEGEAERSHGRGPRTEREDLRGPKGLQRLKEALARGDPGFTDLLRAQSREARGFVEALFLSTLRKRAAKKGMLAGSPAAPMLRLAMVGGYSLYPLHELTEHFLFCEGFETILFAGDYDNYVSEIMDDASELHAFEPETVALFPPERRCSYRGKLTDPRQAQEEQARGHVAQVLDLCRRINDELGSEVILANYPLPAHHDPGAYRGRSLGSDWAFRKLVNLELGLNAPSYVRICDVEFLAARRGTLEAQDPRSWFESKQPGSPGLIFDIAREISVLVRSLRKPQKKVLVMDLDNTLWGGEIGDDGVEGIELGDTSPRGEAFKAFQQYVLSPTERGIVLAVCSKNDTDKALEPFEKHPDMVLRMKDIVSFKANWNPKSDNLREMARELNLGLDSFVFLDDNRAEIEIVRQFTPEVATIWIGDDPSRFVGILKDSRMFEPISITAEDGSRGDQYHRERQREQLMTTATDMPSYLASLEMKAVITEFLPIDVPRISQLINKSNQFNLTSRRRTEGEVQALIQDPGYIGFTIRLTDRFGDHGLICVVVLETRGELAEIDTWLMSCRVLKRQVEEETANEIFRLARARGCFRVRGVYLPTARNQMVRNLLSDVGLGQVGDTGTGFIYESSVSSYIPKETRITIARRSHESQ